MKLKKTIGNQLKLTFNDIHESHTNYDDYPFKRNEVLMQKPISFRFAVFELSMLLMHETYYATIQQYFGGKTQKTRKN